MANHQKEDVLVKANLIWPEILVNLAGMDSDYLSGKKEGPCPLCGGDTRFIYRIKKVHELDKPFYCRSCGSRDGLGLFIKFTGLDFPTAINKLGDYVGNIPTEKLEVKQREHQTRSKFPNRYKFDPDLYDTIKKAATVDLSAWQRVNGLNMMDILKSGDDALIPLLNDKGVPVDFVLIDIDGNYQTTAGNKSIPDGFYSVFGEKQGKRNYIAVSPLVAVHASIYMQRKVICCYELSNIWEVGKQNEDPPVVIVSNLEETQEADINKFEQMIYNAKNRTVNHRVYQPFEIMDLRNKNDNR